MARTSHREKKQHRGRRQLGAGLRKLRKERGLSLAKLAAPVGVTSGLISQVENGRADPSLTTLRRIAEALGVPVFCLFARENEQTHVRPCGERFVLNAAGGRVQYEFVSDPNDEQIEFTMVRAKRGSASSVAPDRHPGREWALVLEGRMALEIESDRHELGPMDSITFDSFRPHRWSHVGDADLCFVSVASPPFLKR